MVTPHKLALCVGPFPVFTGNTHIGNRFSLTDDSSHSSAETNLICFSLHTEKEEGIKGGGQLWNSSPSSYKGVEYFLHFLFFFTFTYFLSLSVSSPPHRTAAIPPRVGLMFQCWVLFSFSNVNTQEPAWVEELPPASAVQRGSMQSNGQMEQPGPKHKYSMRHTITARF